MRRMTRGLGALLLLAVLLVGLPVVLITAGVPLIPDHLDAQSILNALLTPDNTGSGLKWLITAIGWISWFIFTALFVLETINMASGQRLHLRAPMLGGAQKVVGGLLLTVLAMNSTSGTALAGPAHHTPAVGAAPSAAPAAGPRTPSVPQTGTVTITDDDTLWSLAEAHYGDGERWPEIYRANKAAIGSNPNVLPEGLVITIPAKPATQAARPATPSAKSPGVAASKAPHQPTGARQPVSPTAPPDLAPRATPTPQATSKPTAAQAPASTSAPQAPAATPNAAAEQRIDREVAADPNSDLVEDGILAGAGLMLAYGLVTTINRRRRRQMREHQPGETLVLPSEDAQRMETAARRTVAATAAPLTIARLDLILRAIAQHHLQLGVPLPVLSAARLHTDRIDLLFAHPCDNIPSWAQPSAADGSVWTVLPGETDDLPFQPDDLMETMAAPYPALVSIGHDQANALILMNVEYAGALVINADSDQDAADTLRSIGVELAMGPWQNDLTLTLVGDVCPGLDDAIDSPNVTRVGNVDELISSLQDRASAQRAVLDGTHTALDHRVSPDAADGWDPEIVLTNQALTSDQADELSDILESMPRVAIAAVTTVDQEITPWRFSLAGNPLTALLEPLNWQLAPLTVSDSEYRCTLELLATSRPEATTPADWWTEDTARELDLIDQEQADAQPITSDQADAQAIEDDSTNRTPRRPNGLKPLRPDAVSGGKSTDELWTTTHNRITPVSITRHHAAAAAPYDLTAIPDPTANPTAPILRILGPVELLGAQGELQRSRRRAQEVMLYLIDHPGVSGQQIARTLTLSTDTIKQTVSHLRRWLGKDPQGQPYLPSGVQNGYRLHPDVTSDWHLADQLLAGPLQQVSTDHLVQALSLIHGSPFEGTTDAAFAFAENYRTHISTRLLDAALLLTDRALDANDIALARWTQRHALLLDTDSEALAAARIKTEYQAGNHSEVDRLITQLHTSARKLGVDLCDQTEQLLQQIAR